MIHSIDVCVHVSPPAALAAAAAFAQLRGPIAAQGDNHRRDVPCREGALGL